MKIILASASDRRQELLSRIVSEFEVCVSNFDEDSINFNGNVKKYVEELAIQKGKAVIDRTSEDCIIISADTVVSYSNEILGKPKNDRDAFEMLKKLSGNTHKVFSGVSVYNKKTNRRLTLSCETEVRFTNISDEEINDYIASKEPLDKAGSYGIQGIGGIFVEEIKGCYYNVVGLPLNATYKMLKEII